MVENELIQLIPCKRYSGNTLKYQNYLLHSMYDPQEEAKRIALKNYELGKLHILFGLGLGYTALELSKLLLKDDFLLVIEPSQSIFEKAKEEGVIFSLQKKANVKIITFGDDNRLNILLRTTLQKYKNQYSFISSQNYNKIFPEKLIEIEQWIKEALYTQILNLNTIKLFAESWQRNFTHNLFSLFEAYPINYLKKSINKPIIVASGGPSLTKQIPLLKKKRNDIFIIAAGSTINSLLKNDIEPDLIVSIDGGLPNYKHFESLNTTIPLACSFTLHEGITKEYKGEKIVFHVKQDEVYEDIVQTFMGESIASFYAGPSVANISVNIATYLTDQSICLIGQDLAYTNNFTHADGNLHSKAIDEEYKAKRKMILTEGYYNESEVLTDTAFLSMKNWFEDFLKVSGEQHRIYNCTEGGAKIQGMNQMSFEEFLNKETPLCISQNDSFNRQFVKLKSQEEWMTFYTHLIFIKNNLEKAKKLATIAKEKVGDKTVLTNKMIKVLEKQDKKLKQSMKDNFLHLVLNPYLYMLHYAKEEESEDQGKVMIKKSLKLYKTIEKAVDSILPDVKMVLEQTEEKIAQLKRAEEVNRIE